MLQSIQNYNRLKGVISRTQLLELLDALTADEQTYAVKKIKALLTKHPEAFNFNIESVNQVFEQPNQTILDGLEYVQENDGFQGLAKAVRPNDIYQMITDKMLTLIKEASGRNYKKKWESKTYGKGYLIPFNFETKKRYRGVNVFLLTQFEIIENPFFLTFKQVEKLGGKIKRGSKGYPVVYFTKLYKVEDAEKDIDFGTYDYKKAKRFVEKNGLNEEDIFYLPILKYYNIFNGNDIEGIDFDLKNFKVGYVENELATKEKSNKLAVPEAIIENYPKPVPKLGFGGDKAFYSPMEDFIKMPYLIDFETVQDYYRTLFHEFSHSTGSEKRLKRDFTGRFGSKKYAFEELVAEWGAVFLSAEAGIIYHNNTNHAEYIKNWNNVLTHIQDDNRFIMRACTEAQKVADFILQYNEKGEPKYFKNLDKITKALEPKKVIKPTPKTPIKKKPRKITKPKPIVKKNNTPKPIQRTKKKATKIKVDKNGQIGLFGADKTIKAIKNSLLNNKRDNRERRFFELLPQHKDLETLLGKVEIQQAESAVMTLSAPQGAGKTTAVFQMMNAFAESGYRTLFASLEEHPNSYLFEKKEDQFLSVKAQANIASPYYSKNNIQDFLKDIEDHDVIFIDSMKKLWQYIKGFDLDNDLRKKYDGKLFIIIFQLTSTGKMRGGSDAQFDGDIISFIEKHDDFSENYIYHDKNRYAIRPIHETKYNIVSQSLVVEEDASEIDIKYSIC